MSVWRRLRASFSRSRKYAGRYPLERTNFRKFPDGYEGTIFTWDIDKTYLQSDFDSLKGLLSMPFDFAIDKRNIPGTDILLKHLRWCESPTISCPLYFISASPIQLRKVIARKMLLDGVEYDGITLKDQVAFVKAGKIKRLTEQIGYKLSALLLNRMELPWTVREVLFGDDSESDALIYSLYADVISGRLRGDLLLKTLGKNGVADEAAVFICSLAENLPAKSLVHRIIIHLEKRTSPQNFEAFGPTLIPCYDTLQMACCLFQDGTLSAEAVGDVAKHLKQSYGFEVESFIQGVLDLNERARLSPANARRVLDDLTEHFGAPVADDLAPMRSIRDGSLDEDNWLTPVHYRAEATEPTT